MIPSGTNSSPVARVIDPVMETLTTRQMIPSGINCPPVARAIDPVIDSPGSITLATGVLLDSEGIIGPVVSVSITRSITLATGGLLDPEGIIGPVVSVFITGSITVAGD
jgi:hypothetical protein